MAGEGTTNIIQERNAAQTGLNLDRSVNQIPKGQLTYALNAAVENFDSNSVNYQNEPGNELCLNFPEDYHLIGTHFINEQSKHIFFLTNPNTGDSEIGYMDNNDCVYRKYIGGKCLNFNIDYPIHKAVHKITNCTTEIYWTDGLNPRRFLDLNNLPYITSPGLTSCDPVVTPEIDCNKLKVQPNFEIPQISITGINNTGNLTAGTYQFAIQYGDASGDPYTSYYSVTNPTAIGNVEITTPDFNYPVGQAIELLISNLDVTGYFQYFNLAVIKTVNAISSVELVGTYFIDQASRSITYTGQNQTQIRLTLNDVFEKFPYYDIAQDLTSVQDVLVWDNLTSIDRVNYQKIANGITLNWQTYKLPANENYADGANSANLRGYLRDEVYAFEIVFLLGNGKQTDGFHIPGRAKNFTELSQPDVPNTNPDFVGDGTSAPYWKIYNTASVSGPGAGENIGNATPYEHGEFAYWESTETYPCNEEIWGDLANQPIRHHKFPDVLVSPIFESGTPTIEYDGTYSGLKIENKAIFPIGVRFDASQIKQLIETSSLTEEEKNNIVGFKIVRGNRNTNKSVVAKGILRNVGEYEREGTSYYFPNYPYNDLRIDPFLLQENNAYDSVCREYKVTVTNVAGTDIIYFDCDNNEQQTLNVPSPQVVNVCSTAFPTLTLPADGTVEVTNYGVWRLCSKWKYQLITGGLFTGNRFSYLPIDQKDEVTVYIEAPFLGQDCIVVNSVTRPVFVSGNGNFTITLLSEVNGGTKNCTFSADNLDAFNNTNSPYRYVFNSPDTSFGSPFLGNVLKLENAIYGKGDAHFVQVRNNANYKLISAEAQQDALTASEKVAKITTPFDMTAMFAAYQSYLTIYVNGITRKNYAKSYNSIAEYDYSIAINNDLGVKQRQIDVVQYLIPGVQNVGDNLNINNFNRESSVYVKTVDTRDGNSVSSLPYPDRTPNALIGGTTPVIQDKSRYTLSEIGNCIDPEKQFEISTITYYGSIKNIFDNQWGQIYSYETIDTGCQVMFNSTSSTIVTAFGGDTFINRFSFKTKLPFFIDNRVGAPDDSDIFYDEIGNVAYPKYWHSGRSILSNYIINKETANEVELTNIISIKAHNFDCPNSQAVDNPGRTYYDGSFYLFAYGIPTFYCESNVNVDLRQAFNNREGDFFPHVSTGIPDQWLQETNVPIAFDNTYYYNPTYSKQNTENVFTHLPVNWDNNQCYTNFPFRAIYSDRQQSFVDNEVNNWLIYRPISFFDFPQNFGNLTSLDGIQNRAVLARFENKSLLYNTMLTIDTSNPQAAYIGNDSLFRSAPPIDFAETDLGYVGSQNKMLLKIPQGQITVDAKRGQVFLIAGNQAKDLSGFGSGLNRFFTDHLAFEILRYFPNVPTDNHFNGVGLHGVYDSKFDRIIITKLDYVPLRNDIKYDAAANEFYIENVFPQNPATTTTTTTLPPTCFCYEVVITSDGGGESFSGGIVYNDCDTGEMIYRTFLNPGTYYQCAVEGTVHFSFGDGSITLTGTCEGCGTTTTTSSTTSTTTTTYPIITRTVVDLTDVNYFCNKSWSLSFNFNTMSWISFHSYIPNFYIAENNFFYSGLNGSCDIEVIAAEIVPTTTTTSTTTIAPPTTTTTTTVPPPDCALAGTIELFDCELAGIAELISEPQCELAGDAEKIYPTTTTTTTVPPLDCELAGSAERIEPEPTTTTTTTTLPPEFFFLAFTAEGTDQRCSDLGEGCTSCGPYYGANGSTLSEGLALYQDEALTIPAVNGYYNDCCNYWVCIDGVLGSGGTCDCYFEGTAEKIEPTTTTTTTTVLVCDLAGSAEQTDPPPPPPTP
jgi:hypothetical protein